MATETLKAVLSARENISRALQSTARAARDAAEAMEDASVDSTTLSKGLDASADQASDLRRRARGAAQSVDTLRERMGDLATASVETATSVEPAQVQLSRFEDEAEEAGDSATGLAGAMAAVSAVATGQIPTLAGLKTQVDGYGDQMRTAAIQSGLFSASTESATLSLAGLQVSLSTALAAAVPLVAVLGSLVTVLFGVATAALAAGGALAALFAGGLLVLGEQAAASSQEIEGTLEGIQHVLGQVKDAAVAALEPLKDPIFADFAISTLEGAVRILGELAQVARQLAPALLPAVDAVAAEFWQQTPTFMAELKALVRDSLPLLQSFGEFMATAIPEALAFFREMIVRLGPELGGLSTGLLDLLVAFVDVGAGILEAILPAVNAMLDAFDELNEATNGAAGALLVLGPAILAFGPGGWVAVAIAGIVALVEAFGLWDEIGGILKGTINTIIELVEFALNVWMAFGKAIRWVTLGFLDFIGLLGPLKGFFKRLISFLSDVLEFFIQVGEEAAKIIDGVMDAVDAVGGVDLGGTDDSGGGDGSGPSGRGPGSGGGAAAPAPTPDRSGSAAPTRGGDTYDINVDARGSDMSEGRIEQLVRRTLEEQSRRDRKRGSGTA